jgi:multidrug efflux pump subunit AcrB
VRRETPRTAATLATRALPSRDSAAWRSGKLTLTLNFRLGTDLNTALVLTQSRVLIAQPRLPQTVQQLGVTVKKVASDYVIVPHLYSPDGSRDQLYLSN